MQSNIIKTQEEIEIIKRSAKIVDECFDRVLKETHLGMTEIELSDFITKTMVELGAQGLSFDTIAAFGENGCEPHHIPTERALIEGDMVTIDMGAILDNYCSDFTRTFALGNPSAKMLEIYETVKGSHAAGLKAVKAGIRCFDIDKECRDYIAEKGYGEAFIHGTGHGVGLLIHEAPTLNTKSEEVLENGMVVTIEPGIYIKDLGGVRIEDMMIVGESEPLSRHTRELIILK
ncbi:MAG: M24 family metallopeptidase [Clostridia bacterium]|nr:M24 family metallopeptidase [Clostridia bacterium]